MLLSPLSSTHYTNGTPPVNTRDAQNDPLAGKRLINVKNTQSRLKRDIESAKSPHVANGSQTLSNGIIRKVLLAATAVSVGLATCGLAYAMTRRSDSFDLQRLPVSNPLIMLSDHQVINGSSQFVNETELLYEFIRAPQASIIDFFILQIIDDIGAIELARNEEIKQHFPEIFNAMEEARKKLVAALKEYKNNCSQSCDSPMPVRVNATQRAKDLIGFLLEADGLDSRLADEVFKTLLSEMGVSEEAYAQLNTYIHPHTSLVDFMIALAENPCDARKTLGKCMEFILIEQTPEGMQRDQDDNRPTTYAATAHPIISLTSDELPIIITTHITNLTNHQTLLTHIIAHEMVHYGGHQDTVYANAVEGIRMYSPEFQDQLYLKLYAQLRNNIASLIDNIPVPMQPTLVDFYNLHVRDDPSMEEIDKINDLKTRLTSDDKLWDSFCDETTDFIAMKMLISYLRRENMALQKNKESWSGFFSDFLEMLI